MATTQVAPLPKLRFVDSNGNALSGGKLFSYAAGTTTKLATYTDQTGSTPNANPVILDTRGEANVWLTPGTAYKLVLSPSTDSDPPSNPFWTVDNLSSGISLPVAPAQGGTPVFFGGATTGSGTAQTLATVTPSNFTLTAGYMVVFTAGVTNTGALTLNVNSQGAKNVFRKTASGPAACVGGEIESGDVVAIVYDGTQFQIINQPSNAGTVTSVATAGLATGGPITGSGTVTVPAANAATTLTGTDTTQALTAGGFAGNKSLAVPGYYKFPGGLIINFGTQAIAGSSSATFTYATAFPTGTLSISATANGATAVGVTTFGLSSAVIANASGSAVTAFVIAIGY